MGMKVRKGKERNHRKQRKRENTGNGGELGKELKMGCVFRIVKMHY